MCLAPFWLPGNKRSLILLYNPIHQLITVLYKTKRLQQSNFFIYFFCCCFSTCPANLKIHIPIQIKKWTPSNIVSEQWSQTPNGYVRNNNLCNKMYFISTQYRENSGGKDLFWCNESPIQRRALFVLPYCAYCPYVRVNVRVLVGPIVLLRANNIINGVFIVH